MVPALPRWVPWFSGVTAVALTVLVVALEGDDSFGARLVSEAAGVLIPLLFVTAGVSGIAEAFRRREWRRRTQFIAVDGVEEARVALAGLASQLMDIVGPALPHNDKRVDIRTAFELPYTQTRDAIFDESHLMALDLARPLLALGLSKHLPSGNTGNERGWTFDSPGQALPLVRDLVDRAAGSADEVERRAQYVQQTTEDLALFVGGVGEKLHIKGLELESQARRLLSIPMVALTEDPADDEVRSAAHAASRYVTLLCLVLRSCRACMRDQLSSADIVVRKRGDKRQTQFITQMEDATSSMAGLTDVAIEAQLHLNRQRRDNADLLATTQRRSDPRGPDRHQPTGGEDSERTQDDP